MQVLVNARDALCAGDTDFVYTVDGLGVLAWAYPSGVNLSAFARGGRNFPDGSEPARAHLMFDLNDTRVCVCLCACVFLNACVWFIFECMNVYT